MSLIVKIFSNIKNALVFIAFVITGIFFALFKIKQKEVKNTKEKLEVKQKELEIQKQVNKEKLEVEKFNVKAKTKKELLDKEIKKLEEVKDEKDSNDNFIDITI